LPKDFERRNFSILSEVLEVLGNKVKSSIPKDKIKLGSKIKVQQKPPTLKETFGTTNRSGRRIFDKPKFKIYDKQPKFKTFNENTTLQKSTNWWQRFEESAHANLTSKTALFNTIVFIAGFTTFMAVDYVNPGTGNLNTTELLKYMIGVRPFLLANPEELKWAEYIYDTLNILGCSSVVSLFKYCVTNDIRINYMYKQACENVGFFHTQDFNKLGFGSDITRLAKESFIEYGRLLKSQLIKEENLVLNRIYSGNISEDSNLEPYEVAKLAYTEFVNEYEKYIAKEGSNTLEIENKFLEGSLIKTNTEKMGVIDNLLVLDDTTSSLKNKLSSLKNESGISEENNISSLKSIKDKIAT